MHAHCVDRDRLEFLGAMLEKGWLSADRLQAPVTVPMKRPSKIYFPVNEIIASYEWSVLAHDEKRIALHLMTFAWSTDDGTLQDNNWALARYLGLTEDQWLSYRETLIKAGWLLQEEGRLTVTLLSINVTESN